MAYAEEIIDDLSGSHGGNPAAGRPRAGWALISDGVMGGVSSGAMMAEIVAGRAALCLRGTVSLENNGGFLQIARDLAQGGGAVDASIWDGIQLDVIGNGEIYNLHLRTADLLRPWASYRQSFVAPAQWTRVHLPFSGFAPHRTSAPLRKTRLRRIGVVAIGRAFAAEIAISDLRFYRASHT